MFKKITTFLLIGMVFLLSVTPSLAQSKSQLINRQSFQNSRDEEISKPDIKKLFADERNRLKTKEILTDSDIKRLEKESLNRQVKRNNLSTTAKVGIGIGIAAVVVLIIVLATRDNDNSPPPAPCEFPPFCN
ncbi:hypothetical protein BH20ACI4_BH20ACI4_15950 [soil metagenome]